MPSPRKQRRLRRKVGVFTLVMALMGMFFSSGFLSPASANGQETCPETFVEDVGGWDKFDGLDEVTETVTIRDGYTLATGGVCYKSSTTVKTGVDYVVNDDGTVTVTSTVQNSNGELQAISHISLNLVPIPTTDPVITYDFEYNLDCDYLLTGVRITLSDGVETGREPITPRTITADEAAELGVTLPDNCEEEGTLRTPALQVIQPVSECVAGKVVTTSGRINPVPVTNVHYWLDEAATNEIIGGVDVAPGVVKVYITVDEPDFLDEGQTNPIVLTINAAPEIECEPEPEPEVCPPGEGKYSVAIDNDVRGDEGSVHVLTDAPIDTSADKGATATATITNQVSVRQGTDILVYVDGVHVTTISNVEGVAYESYTSAAFTLGDELVLKVRLGPGERASLDGQVVCVASVPPTPRPEVIVPIKPDVTHQVIVCTADYQVVTTSGTAIIKPVEGGYYLLGGKEVSGTISLEPGTYTFEFKPREGYKLFEPNSMNDLTVVINPGVVPECTKPPTGKPPVVTPPPTANPPATCPSGTTWNDTNGNKVMDAGECKTPPVLGPKVETGFVSGSNPLGLMSALLGAVGLGLIGFSLIRPRKVRQH